PGGAIDPLPARVLGAPLGHPRQVAHQLVEPQRGCLDRLGNFDVCHYAPAFRCRSKKESIRCHASSAAAASYATIHGSVHAVLPVCSNRKPCLAVGYSLTSCSTPTAVSADSSFAAAPLRVRSL